MLEKNEDILEFLESLKGQTMTEVLATLSIWDHEYHVKKLNNGTYDVMLEIVIHNKIYRIWISLNSDSFIDFIATGFIPPYRILAQ
jgi:hypothetical protein